MNRRKIGNIAENIACDYLSQNGFIILEKNYSCLYGEIDIIAEDKSDIVFIEVKARKNFSCGTPAAAVNKTKQLKIRNTALNFISSKNIVDKNFRFDVIEIVLGKKITHLKNAFDV